MLSLAQLKGLKMKNDGSNYQRPIKVKLLSMGEQIAYVNAKKQKKELWNLAFGDESGQIKGVLYNRDLHDQLVIGESYAIRNFILKKQFDKVEIVMTQATKVGKCSNVSVTPESQQCALELLKTPVSPVKKIRDIKKSPLKAKVSVEGKVVQV